MLRHILFDLDDTLYNSECGLWEAIRGRIGGYMVERLGLPAERVPAMRERYFRDYGTTLSGLRHDYQVDVADYMSYVHDLPLERYLAPDPDLNGMLARLPLGKSIFTNADAPHAQRVLERLGVARHFQHLIDLHTLELVNKPEPEAYQRALAIVGQPAAACVLVEDSPRNLQPARALGMLTVLVSPQPQAEAADYWIPSILNLERVLAGLIGQTL